MSIVRSFKASCDRNPGKVAIAWRNQSWTFSDFDRLTGNMAQNLLHSGVRPGDRVALHTANSPETAMAVMGCLRAGCVLVPINTRLKGREIDFVLRQSGSVCYLGESELYDSV